MGVIAVLAYYTRRQSLEAALALAGGYAIERAAWLGKGIGIPDSGGETLVFASSVLVLVVYVAGALGVLRARSAAARELPEGRPK